MINNIVLGGRLTADAVLKSTLNNSFVCNFNIANNRKSPNGKEETTFMEIVIFGNYAQAMSPYLTKGLTVDVIGKLVQENWTNVEGQNLFKYKIHAKEIDFRTPKSQNIHSYENNNEGEDDEKQY
ncbi:single-stranded DNA-binding protein [Arcobacter lacus]|uniref:single-stranded DNA-binding protein n=1 Tax=Arcobacter lacus TaxID=1912876 RepID=UPI0021BB9902|nr:single-stranded DNA-binding protein [Arcobacter lacus]MCT7910718.1 single-stranded DNA-binding protein [Arcobacter lacus]